MDRDYRLLASWVFKVVNDFIYILAGYPDLMNDCLMTLTSSFQLVAIRFARCKAPRIVLLFHLSGMADFQCICSFPGF